MTAQAPPQAHYGPTKDQKYRDFLQGLLDQYICDLWAEGMDVVEISRHFFPNPTKSDPPVWPEPPTHRSFIEVVLRRANAMGLIDATEDEIVKGRVK